MNQVNIESGTSQPKGTEVRTEEFNGFTMSNKTTVEDLLNSIRELAQKNYDAGYKAGQCAQKNYRAGYKVGQWDGYEAGNIVTLSIMRPAYQWQVLCLRAGKGNPICAYAASFKAEWIECRGAKRYQIKLYDDKGEYQFSLFVDKIEKGNDYVPVPRS